MNASSATIPLRDPAHDPTASYALDPGYVHSLTDRVVSTTGESVTTSCPFNGQPLAQIPQSSAGDVAEAMPPSRPAQ
jgi:hypothetical protein